MTKPLVELTERMLEELLVEDRAELLYGGDHLYALIDNNVVYELKDDVYVLIGESRYETTD